MKKHAHYMNEPLSTEEFDRLTDFLKSIGVEDISISKIDGYFAALICSPETVLPSQYLREIFGEDFSFSSTEEAAEIMGLLMRHWNTISTALLKTLSEDDLYLPVLVEDENSIANGNEWAEGFLQGIDRSQEGWRELLEDDENGGCLIPIMILAHEHDPDPTMRPNPISTIDREKLLQTIPVSLTLIYKYLNPFRQAAVLNPQKNRDSTVISKNWAK
ncbi:MAG: UPF0149 family protein [Desulfosporosinus sp.]|nr:UPF0149 family protein [Desulfosporosinus sp.]